MNRRDAVKAAIGVVALGTTAPILYLRSGLLERAKLSEGLGANQTRPRSAAAGTPPPSPTLAIPTPTQLRAVPTPTTRPPAPNTLVVLQLTGGNDGLNTVIPYGSGAYYSDRPTLAIPEADVLKLTGSIGLHPNLAALKKLYDEKRVAIVQGVGYPLPDRSHFRSMDIWHTADPSVRPASKLSTTGWLGRYLDQNLANDPNPLKAIGIGSSLPKTLWGEKVSAPTLETIASFRFLGNAVKQPGAEALLSTFRSLLKPSGEAEPPYLALVQRDSANAYDGSETLQKVATGYRSAVSYPATALGNALHVVAQVIAANVGTRVFYVQLGGFDDHANEKLQHATLMTQVAEAVSAFYRDLEAAGSANNVLLMTMSEFGRRVRENGSGGTDHGTAAPHLVVGGAVKGGIYGDDPILLNLDDGDLRYQIDFRSVYGTVLQGWLGADSVPVLGGKFESLPFV